jgi:hypothetical protein
MKKLLFTTLLFLTSVFVYSVDLNGKYLTEDYNTKTIDGLIKVTYTFTNDSLYIDVYPSGCGISAMSLKQTSDNDYDAVETLYDITSGDIIRETIYHLSFFPCVWDKDSWAVYRDGTVVDIIKKID